MRMPFVRATRWVLVGIDGGQAKQRIAALHKSEDVSGAAASWVLGMIEIGDMDLAAQTVHHVHCSRRRCVEFLTRQIDMAVV